MYSCGSRSNTALGACERMPWRRASRSMPHATDDRPAAEAPERVRPALAATNLTKRYGDVVAVYDLSFALEPGSITRFLRANGAGKTTTLRGVLSDAVPT